MKKINWLDHSLNFVAVIVGVSMAFYIGSSAEEAKQKEETRKILSALIQELDKDILTYTDYQIPNNEDQLEIIQNAQRVIQDKSYDSLGFYIQKAFGFRNFAPQNVTFNSIKSSGKIDLITDFDLRLQMATFYESYVQEASFRGQGQVDFNSLHIVPWMIESTDFTNPDISELDMVKISNMLILYRSIIVSKLDQYQKVVDKGIELKEALKSYQATL